MATKSILKDITIKDKKLSRNLISALERAEKQHSKKNDVTLSKSCKEIKGAEIKTLFGVDK